MKFTVSRKDFEVTWFSGKGGGGQHRNKHQNCCRLKHKDTGIITTGQSNKERAQNQKEALNNMAKNKFFLAYCEQKLRELETGETIEDWVEKQMEPKNLIIQRRNEEGKWEEI